MTAEEVLIYQTVTDDRKRGGCATCSASWDECLAPADWWVPCCHRCDHP